MLKDFKFQMADIVKDEVTGFTGVVTGASHNFHNCDTYRIQPRELKDGELQKPIWLDGPQLQFVGKAEGITVTPVQEPDIKLGDEVECILSKYKGTVVNIAYFITGCSRIGIQAPGVQKTGAVMEDNWTPAGNVRVIKPAAPEVVKEQTSPKKPGGPMKAPKMARTPR